MTNRPIETDFQPVPPAFHHASRVMTPAMMTFDLLPWLIVAAAVVALLLYGPIGQLADYHNFADRRNWLGIPNAADVLSNIPFLLIGLYGLHTLWGHRATREHDPSRSGYTLFFAAIALTAFGSSWYHLAPDNARLVWDRLPIALACAGLLSAVWSESLHSRGWFTVALACFAVISVAWWRYTDLHGVDDLRPYLLLQCLPLVLIPLLQWQQGKPHAERWAFAAAIGLFALAKLFELADHTTFDELDFVSGHTLKHLLAAAASAVIAWDLARRLKAAAP
jgi:hypothetical protein